jgi:hypothetical protein
VVQNALKGGFTLGTDTKKLIQLIHIGKSKLSLADDDYRALLQGAAGKDSCTNMNAAELSTVLRAMKKLGFETTSYRAARGFASGKQLALIKHLWQFASRAKTDSALNAYAARIAGVSALRFLTARDAQKVIISLRALAKQEGLDPDDTKSEVV